MPKGKTISPTKTPSRHDRSYAAGVFDGEGTVYIQKGASGRAPTSRLRVFVTNTNLDLLNFFQERWGGGIYTSAPQDAKRKRCCVWVLTCGPALAFVRDILPYTVVKRLQCTNALILGQFLPQRGGGRHGKRTTPLMLEMGDLIRRDNLWLNARGSKPKPRNPMVEFIDNPAVFGYEHLTVEHLRQAVDKIRPLQIPPAEAA